MPATSCRRAEAKNEEKEERWRCIDADEVTLGAEIGGGGVAVVYKGKFRGDTVAVKVLFDPKANEKAYMDELLVMSELRHPNIVSFLGASMNPPKMFFVMEICESSLHELIHNNKDICQRQKLVYATDVANGITYLHSKQLTHRDIKPLNVLKGRDGKLKICDFGLVRTRNPGAGTPAYMAPELLEAKPFSHKVDVFAFGILLNQLFTGLIPYREYDYDDIRRAVCNGQRPQLPRYDTPQDLKHLISKCWASNPFDRPDFQPEINASLSRLINQECHTKKHSFCAELDAKAGGDILDSLLGGL